ncbi:MAG: hypothetical protein L0196_09205 [candidate division Zixibacteria bacterium]|nr:hypothetical protein [candidate division Zixibacteria bacterium]
MALPLCLILITYDYALGRQPANRLSCSSSLPKEALKEIAARFKGWRILEKKDINSVGQTLWDKTRAGECPGIAAGNYDDSNVKGYAILIIPRDSVKRQIKLLLFQENSSEKYAARIIYEAVTARHSYPVIYKGEPGTYTETASDDYGEDDRADSIKTKHDVIICKFIKKGALAFYYKNGKFYELAISD